MKKYQKSMGYRNKDKVEELVPNLGKHVKAKAVKKAKAKHKVQNFFE